MLKHWQTHAEYQQFLSDAVSHLNESQRKKLSSYSHSIAKLSALNLDPVRDIMLPFYSSTGRPALSQPQILRSFVLLMNQHCLSIDSWVDTLAHDDLLAILIGCSSDSLPPLGSYYDFINCLWLMNPSLEKFGRKDTFHYMKKTSLKPGKGKKHPNRHPSVTKEEKCTCQVPCSSSPYGRCLYTKPDWDIRLYPPVTCGINEYKKDL